MRDRARLQLSRRKVRDRSIALLLVGAVLLMPPIGALSLIDGHIASIPIPIVYVFVVWILLIGGTALLSNRLQEYDDSIQAAESADPEA